MSLSLKVLWSEGATLGPHHFQQQDQYHEARLNQTATAIRPHLWGVRALRWNADALRDNMLRVDSLGLIFQDGEVVEAPYPDVAPLPVDLAKLPAGEQMFTFYAALPAFKSHGGNSGPVATSAGPARARYEQIAADTLDLYSGAFNLPVTYLRKTVYLMSHLEPRDAYLSFPVIRLRRVVSGGFEVDTTFMPPALSTAAVTGLQPLLDSLLGKLNVEIEVLYGRHRQVGKYGFEVHTGDTASFWMLSMISSAAASLSHVGRYQLHHPEVLFDKLITLTGGLMSFSNEYTLADLPAYQHEDLGACFIKIDTMIRKLLTTVIATRYVVLPLVKDMKKEGFYLARLDGMDLGDDAALWLSVKADETPKEMELSVAVPGRMKVAGADDIERIVGRAISGLNIRYQPQVPTSVPVRQDTLYFSIDKNSPLYPKMIEQQGVGVYVSDGFVGLKLELFAIKTS